MVGTRKRLGFATARSIVGRDDFLSGAITACTVLVFVAMAVGLGEQVFLWIVQAGGGADNVAMSALLLNMALILLAWSRHREARKAVREQNAAEQRAQLLRTRDSETDLLNRNSLRDRANALIEKAREERGNVALMVINLNRFKKINENYGPAVGDGLLRIIAAVICGNVPLGALCARLGSDEFAIALPFEHNDEERVMALAEDLQAQLGLPVEIMGANLKVSVSIGLSHLGYNCIDFTSLLRRADVAMNAAKESQSDRPLWFDSKMERSLRAHHEVEVGLERGIPLGEFVPYYQPVVEFGTARIRGFEMLARWHHPAGGVIEPGVFIPVAEQNGSIGALSEALMRTAFLEAKHWDPSLKLSVNISPTQLADPWLAQKILKLLSETGFPAQRLEVEITESSLFEDLEVAQSVVASIKSQGISLALDDFGTGYSSLAHLRSLPFDRIKIDRSFLLALTKDPESLTILKTMVTLAQSLNIPVVLEGVESAAIELRVRDLGCESGQGWLYGHAAPAAQTRLLLAQNGLGPLEPGEQHEDDDSDAALSSENWPRAVRFGG